MLEQIFGNSHNLTIFLMILVGVIIFLFVVRMFLKFVFYVLMAILAISLVVGAVLYFNKNGGVGEGNQTIHFNEVNTTAIQNLLSTGKQIVTSIKWKDVLHTIATTTAQNLEGNSSR
jgi:energy-coupling factor transporter transmembrane protein EcfT